MHWGGLTYERESVCEKLSDVVCRRVRKTTYFWAFSFLFS